MRKGENEEKIFKQFIYNEELSFSEIFRKTKINSNLLAYFLKKMASQDILKKTKTKKYRLTTKGERLLPFYSEQKSLTPLVVILIGIVKDEKTLLLKREKRPYKGLWSLVSGRMLLNEGISDATKRIFEKKLMAKCKFKKTSAVIHERFIEKETKHSFVFFFVEVEPLGKTLEHSGLKWFPLNKIPKNKTIASDYWMLKNKLGSDADVIEEILERKGKKMKLIN